MPYPYAVVVGRICVEPNQRRLAMRIWIMISKDAYGRILVRGNETDDIKCLLVDGAREFYWSRRRSVTADNRDEGSYRIVVGNEEVSIEIV